MASAASAIFPQIANYNPQGFVQGNQLQQQNIGLTAAQAAAEQARVPLIQQQTQGAELQNQLVKQQIADQKAIGAAWAGWDPDSDPSGKSLIQKAISNGATPARVMEVQQHMAQYNANLATADKTTLENHKARNDDFAGKIQAILDADPKDQDNLIAGYKNALLADDPSAQIPDHFGLNEFKALQKVHQYQSTQVEEALKAQETKTSAATAAEAAARTSEVNLKTQLEQAELDLHKTLLSSPQGLDNFVERSIPKAQYPQLHQAAVNEASMTSNLKDLRGVVEKYSQDAREQEKTIAVETNPQILAAKRKTAELQASYENALRQGDEANKEYYGSAVDFNTTKAASQSIQKVVELAQSGNPLAANQLKALVPEFTNAMMDIKRLGGMQNDKNFTSAFDTAMDTASSIFKGQPFTASTLQQIMPYVRTIANNAADKHNATVQTVNQTYKKNYQQEQRPYSDIANPKTPSGAARKVGDSVTLKGGRKVTITKVYPDGSFDY